MKVKCTSCNKDFEDTGGSILVCLDCRKVDQIDSRLSTCLTYRQQVALNIFAALIGKWDKPQAAFAWILADEFIAAEKKRMDDLEARHVRRFLVEILPDHKASLSLEHNSHKDCYETVEQWEKSLKACSNQDDADPVTFGWVSVEQREKAIKEDSVWCLQWYPLTPIGFFRLFACDLEVLLEESREVKRGESVDHAGKVC